MSENKKSKRGPMGGHANGAMLGEKAKDFKGTMKRLIGLFKAYKVRLILILLFAIGGAVFSIVGPKILGNATTELFNGAMSKFQGGEGINFDLIGQILLTLIALYVVSALFTYMQGWLMTGIANKITYNLREQISEKIHRMPFKYFDSKSHGEVLSVITNDIDTVSMSLSQDVTQVISSIVMLIGIVVMMLSIDWAMTLVALAVLPITMILMMIIVSKSQKYFKAQQEYLGHVNGRVEEAFGGQNVIRVFNAEDSVLKEFEQDNDMLHKSAWKAQFISGMMMPIMTFVGNLSYVLMTIVGGYFTIQGRIQVGDILSFIQYGRQFMQPIATISQTSAAMQATAAAAERVFAFLDEEEEDQYAENPVSTENLKGNVEFKNVHFGYNPENIIINDFSANVKEGQKIAIVGPTGAGKTTLIKLLMRFYDVNSGAIFVDGHNIKDFNRGELREMFGMVLQDTWLFGGSVMENIRYGKETATDEEVIAAAKSAHVHHFIKTLPGGYNMELNEEATNVSGGQKQLLTIARAILADPKILILDEATSSVDTRTEERIQKAMDNLLKGRTSFVIAHRLSTIRDADLIFVMKDGDIVEQGNHDELIAANGFYAELYNSQFEKVAS